MNEYLIADRNCRFFAGKRLFVAAVAMVLMVAAVPAEARVKLLFYGNSFTLGQGASSSVSSLVGNLAVSAGEDAPFIVSGAQSGWSLADHLASNTAIINSTIPSVWDWDYVVLQDYSTRPTHVGDLAGHRADYMSMYQAVAVRSPNVKAIGFETWSRAPGHSFFGGSSPQFPGGPAEMQSELQAGYALSTADVNAYAGAGTSKVASVGDAWESTGWDNLHYTDLYHANNRGTLLAAMVIYGTIFQDDVSDIDIGGILSDLSLTAAEGAYLAAAADEFIVPEPSACLLFAVGGTLILKRRRNRR